MSFNFGSSTPSNTPAPSFGGAPAPAPAFGAAPAPSSSGFQFGSSTPAPSFGTSAPAPSFGSSAPAMSFGSSAPAPPAFGSSTVPPPPSFTSSSSIGGGVFGSTAPAPSGGSAFGSFTSGFSSTSSAPASGSFGAFGSTSSPAPGSNLFGGTTTPAPASPFAAFGGPAPAPTGFFGAAPAPPATQQPVMISGSTQYAALPPEVKQAIDNLHNQIMNHKRSVATVRVMAPALLRQGEGDVAATGPSLADQLQAISQTIQELEAKLNASYQRSLQIKDLYQKSTEQSIVHGLWQTEAYASRYGVKLSTQEASKDPDITSQIRKFLEEQAAHVDQLVQVPSPYLWQTLQDLEKGAADLQQMHQALQRLHQQRQALADLGIAPVVQGQTQNLIQVARVLAHQKQRLEEVRAKYRRWEKGQDVLEQERIRELRRNEERQAKIMQAYVEAKPAAAAPADTAPSPGLFGFVPAPSTGGLFGGPSPASAPGAGLFGTTAPAPVGGGLFGSSAPAPAVGGSTTTPVPAPTGGGLFGAPAPSAPAFGSTSNKSNKSKSRGSRRK